MPSQRCPYIQARPNFWTNQIVISNHRPLSKAHFNEVFLDESQDLNLKYGAGHVVNLFIPVTACKLIYLFKVKVNFWKIGMIAVVASIQTIADYTVPDTENKAYIIYTPFHPTDADR